MTILQGAVISTKMQKTIVVKVTRRVAHPIYKKLMKKSKHFKVHVGEVKVSVGDNVWIKEVRPLAGNIHFVLAEGKK